MNKHIACAAILALLNTGIYAAKTPATKSAKKTVPTKPVAAAAEPVRNDGQIIAMTSEPFKLGPDSNAASTEQSTSLEWIPDFPAGGPVSAILYEGHYNSENGHLTNFEQTLSKLLFVDPQTGDILKEIKGAPQFGTFYANPQLSPDGQALLVEEIYVSSDHKDRDSHILVLNPRTGEERGRFRFSKAIRYGGYRFTTPGMACIGHTYENDAYMVDLKTGLEAKNPNNLNYCCTSCLLSPNKDVLASEDSGTSEGDVMFMRGNASGKWTMFTSQGEYTAYRIAVNFTKGKESSFMLTLSDNDEEAKAAFSPDGKYLAHTNGADLGLWEAKGFTFGPRFNDIAGQPLFSPDSQTLAVTSDKNGVSILNKANGTWTVTAKLPYKSTKTTFSGDSRILALEMGNRKLMFFSAKTGKQLFESHGEFRFSPKGGILMLTGSDNTELFDTQTWELIAKLPHTFSPNYPFMGFSMDDKSFVMQNYNAINVWHVGGIRQLLADYLERSVNRWQKKGPYEKTADYLARVNDASRAEYIKKLNADFIAGCTQFLSAHADKAEYDPDNETFKMEFKEHLPPAYVKVSPQDAPGFKAGVDSGILELKDPVWSLDKDFKFMLTKAQFAIGGKTFPYDAGSQASFNIVDLKLNFAKPEITAPQGVQTAQARETRSEVAVGDPVVETPGFNREANAKKFALVIGIENYRSAPAAKFAERDAASVRTYMRAMGVPERNIFFLTGANATKSAIVGRVDELLPKNLGADSSLFVYYSGHGSQDEKGNSYLVPWDGELNMLASTAIPVKQFYAYLKKLRSREVLVALDACFSGSGARSAMPEGARPLIITKIETDTLPPNMAVITSASGNEISGAHDTAGHGLFTYYMLKNIGERGKTGKEVSVNDLFKGIAESVADEAHRQNREQTPQIFGNSELPLF